MCALRADMIMPLCEKILSTGAELAGTQNTREKGGCRRGKSSTSLSRWEDAAVGSNVSLLMTVRYLWSCCDAVVNFHEAKIKSSRTGRGQSSRPRPRTKFWPRGQLGLEDLTSLRPECQNVIIIQGECRCRGWLEHNYPSRVTPYRRQFAVAEMRDACKVNSQASSPHANITSVVNRCKAISQITSTSIFTNSQCTNKILRKHTCEHLSYVYNRLYLVV